MELLTSLILFLSLSSLLHAQPEQTTTSTNSSLPGTIERTTKQQIIASIPPNTQQNSVPFLTSPAGTYTAYLIRRGTAPGAGGFGNDFCYMQVEDTSTEESVWESECGPVSSDNACSLVFTQDGLEIFDGSHWVWSTRAQSADDNFLETLELVDQGDMWIRDKGGELAWKASDEPRANQGCGLRGSPGLAPALPPFAVPIGGHSRNLPFGQPAQGGQQQQQQPEAAVPDDQQQRLNEVSQSFGFSNQPLVDNNPYDSGSPRGAVHWTEMGVALLLALLVC